MWRPDPKSILSSKTFWFGMVAVANGLATIYLGYSVDIAGHFGLTQDQASQLASMFFDAALASGGFSLTGGLGAIAGRLAATRPATITGSAPADPGKLAMPRASEVPWEDAAVRPSDRPRPDRSVTLPAGIVLALALALGGCQTVTQQNGDESLTATALFTNINVASDCSQYDASGNVLSTTHHTLTTNGDTATLHEAGQIFSSALSSVLAKAATGGAGLREGAVPSREGSPAVTGCSGEKTTATAAAPAPAPPAKPAAFERGWHEGTSPDGRRTRRLLDRVGDDGTVAYATPGGRVYRVSARAWLAFVGRDAGLTAAEGLDG